MPSVLPIQNNCGLPEGRVDDTQFQVKRKKKTGKKRCRRTKNQKQKEWPEKFAGPNPFLELVFLFCPHEFFDFFADFFFSEQLKFTSKQHPKQTCPTACTFPVHPPLADRSTSQSERHSAAIKESSSCNRVVGAAVKQIVLHPQGPIPSSQSCKPQHQRSGTNDRISPLTGHTAPVRKIGSCTPKQHCRIFQR